MSTKSSIDQQLGKRFKLVRLQLELNQYEMAKLCEVSQALISYIEKGEKEVPSSVYKILFTEKNISPVYIIAGEGPMEYKQDQSQTQLLKNFRTMQADIEELKGKISLLYAERNKNYG